jgi:hypothetical protein
MTLGDNATITHSITLNFFFHSPQIYKILIRAGFEPATELMADAIASTPTYLQEAHLNKEAEANRYRERRRVFPITNRCLGISKARRAIADAAEAALEAEGSTHRPLATCL